MFSTVSEMFQGWLKSGSLSKRHLISLLVALGSAATIATHLRVQTKLLTRGDASTARETLRSNSKRKIRLSKELLKELNYLLKLCFPKVVCLETLYIVVLLIHLVLRTVLTETLTRLGGAVSKCIVSKDWSTFFKHLAQFAMLTVPCSVLNSSRVYWENKLVMHLRLKLSEKINSEYLRGVRFYYVANNIGTGEVIDNPDHRVTSDVNAFSEKVVDMIPRTIRPVLEMVYFTYQLVQVLGWQGPTFLYAYFAFSAIIKRSAVPAVALFVAKESELEGYYRTAHNRLTTYAEEIAFYDGSQLERRNIESSLGHLSEYEMKYQYIRLLIGVIDQLIVKYWVSIAFFVVVSMPHILDLPHIRNASHADIARDYIFTASYMMKLGASMGDLVLLGNNTNILTGYAHRIYGVLHCLINRGDSVERFTVKEDLKSNEELVSSIPEFSESAQVDDTKKRVERFLLEWKKRCEGQSQQRLRYRRDVSRDVIQPVGGGRVEESDHITFEGCDMVSPDGRVLIKQLTMDVSPGMNVIVTGPNGCGKSSLFRVIGELWPLSSGTLRKPRREEIVFIPQKPYMVLGTLRDQIIYPHSKAQMEQLGITDGDLEQLLQLVDPLSRILQTWRWDDHRDWITAFSGGQKQRVAMARLFYHRPKFGILDECTSAVSIDVEDAIYTYAKQLGITIFTVSHRATLIRHHDYTLSLDGRGNWVYEKVSTGISK